MDDMHANLVGKITKDIYMIKNNIIPYVMILENNNTALGLQAKTNTSFAKTNFFAKGSYIFIDLSCLIIKLSM